ncbi:AcrID1 family anti-CRISPR protein, partial [Nonomuraea insulae]
MKYEVLNQIVNQVFEDSTVDELQLRFREDVEVSPEE